MVRTFPFSYSQTNFKKWIKIELISLNVYTRKLMAVVCVWRIFFFFAADFVAYFYLLSSPPPPFFVVGWTNVTANKKSWFLVQLMPNYLVMHAIGVPVFCLWLSHTHAQHTLPTKCRHFFFFCHRTTCIKGGGESSRKIIIENRHWDRVSSIVVAANVCLSCIIFQFRYPPFSF